MVGFSCISQEGHMSFILYFVSVVYLIDWFADGQLNGNNWKNN